MRISFDLDDTLICYRGGVPQEPRLHWFRRLLVHDEPLRLGAPELIRQLRQRGWEVWIYTTSNRSPAAVRRWLRCHGVRIDGMINQDAHDWHLRRSPQYRPPSKNPAAFEIDLHVDDSDGVRLEGEQHGFQVVVVTSDDRDWTAKVLCAADELEGRGVG
jgi:FMN phosphatase YigB (HAD superfamily)